MMPGVGLFLFELFFDRYHSKLDCEDERLGVSKKRKADKLEEEGGGGPASSSSGGAKQDGDSRVGTDRTEHLRMCCSSE